MSPATPAGLYSDVIRERWRRPRFRGELADATASAEDVNPLCGDRVRMMVRVHDGQIAAARFAGDSCAICTASADVVSESIEGKSPAVALGDSTFVPELDAAMLVFATDPKGPETMYFYRPAEHKWFTAAYVGDSPEDVQMAHAAGVFAVGIPGGFPNRHALGCAAPELLAPSLEAAVSTLLG